MVEVDLGVALGLAGIATGLVSLVYARTEATAAHRQAEEARRVASVEVNRAMADRVRELRWKVAGDAALMREYLQANPGIGQAYGEPFSAGLIVRDFLDATEDVYFLRKDGIVDDHFWRSWMSSTLPFARLPTFRRVVENARQRGAWEPEFEAFLERAAQGRPPDPLGRVEVTGASPAPAPSGTPPR